MSDDSYCDYNASIHSRFLLAFPEAPMAAVEPRKRPRQRRSQETVEVLLEATTRVLKEEGYDRASTNRIARVAGVSVGSLYQYFPNKEALVMEVIKRHAESQVALLSRMAVELADAPMAVAVRTYITAMIEAHMVDPELHRVLVQQAMHLGLEHLQQLDEACHTLVCAYLTRRRDEILPDDLDLAAYMVVTAVESLVHRAVLARAPYDKVTLAEEVTRLVLRYLTGACEG